MALTKTDLKKITEIFQLSVSKILGELTKDYQSRISEYLDFKFQKLEKDLTEKIDHLPTKDEFYDRTDKILGSQHKDRDEFEMVSSRVSDHEDRIQALEDK